jgi:DNA-binding winged helix-turn-helix (wHTH) protein/TolB-like protein/Tfp pilus assembly protein PilF
MDLQQSLIYAFGDFHLDVSKRLLLRAGEPIPLTPKVFDTLLYLVEHAGTALSKDELMSAVWPDTVVEENNLGQNISKLRSALGEGRGDHRWIVTLPGHGYRFVSEVKLLPREATGEGSATESFFPSASGTEVTPLSSARPEHTRGRNTHFRLLLLSGLLLAILTIAGLYFWHARSSAVTDAPVRSIAVLPFKPLVPQSRDEALELGMADALITKLSATRKIIVRPISSIRRYNSLEQDPEAAGRELGVDTVLDGTIQRWGDRIRVSGRLIHVSDDTTLWAGQFDGKFDDVFGVQDSIAERIAEELAPRLTGDERKLLARRYTDNAEAYELYLRGRFFWDKRTRESTNRAIEYFQQALARDPNYALAYAGLAESYRGLPIMNDVPAAEAFPKAREAARKALAIDNSLAEAHTALAFIKYSADWDWQGAEKEYRLALELDPNALMAHVGYANLLSCLGRHEEALEQIDRAAKLAPVSSLVGALKGEFLFEAHRYSQAVEQLNKTLEIDPNFWIAQVVIGKNYERLGQYEAAIRAFRNAQASWGGVSEPISLTAYTYAATGRRQQAERILSEMLVDSKTKYVPPYNIAMIYQGLENSDDALKWLERAYVERDIRMVFLGVDAKWDPLRNDRRFISLLKRMNLAK